MAPRSAAGPGIAAASMTRVWTVLFWGFAANAVFLALYYGSLPIWACRGSCGTTADDPTGVAAVVQVIALEGVVLSITALPVVLLWFLRRAWTRGAQRPGRVRAVAGLFGVVLVLTLPYAVFFGGWLYPVVGLALIGLALFSSPATATR